MKRDKEFFVEADDDEQILRIFQATSDKFMEVCEQERDEETKRVGYSNLVCVDL